MKKKYLFFALILIIIFVFFIFFRSAATKDDLFKDFNTENITDIYISSVGGDPIELSVNEREYFISLLGESNFRKKLVPNIQKFEPDVVLFIYFSNTDDIMTLKFELERQILGVEGKTKKMEQFLLVDDTKLTGFFKETTNK